MKQKTVFGDSKEVEDSHIKIESGALIPDSTNSLERVIQGQCEEISDLEEQISDLESEKEELEQEVGSLESEYRDGELPVILQTDQMKVDLLKEHWDKITLDHIDKLVESL